jgi:ADP-ribosylglycohydrolase
MDPHQRAWLSLEGLSVGDTFGERFFGPPDDALRRIAGRELRPPPWTYTDDTEMALSIVEVLRDCGKIDQDSSPIGLRPACSSTAATARARTPFFVG